MIRRSYDFVTDTWLSKIARIWKAQFDALTSKEEPELSDKETDDDNEGESLSHVGSPMVSVWK